MFRVELISCMDGCAAHHGVQGARNLLSAVTDIDLMKRKAAAVRVIQGQISQRGRPAGRGRAYVMERMMLPSSWLHQHRRPVQVCVCIFLLKAPRRRQEPKGGYGVPPKTNP